MIENISMILKGGLIIIFIALALIIAVAPSLTKKEDGDQDETMVNDVEQLISNLRKNWISPAKYLEIRGYIPKDFVMETDSSAGEPAKAEPTDAVETTTVKKNETIDTNIEMGDISQNSTSEPSPSNVTTESTTQESTSTSTTAATTAKPSSPAVNMSSEAIQAAKKKSFLNTFKNKVIHLFAKSEKDNHENVKANPINNHPGLETVPVPNKVVELPANKNSISNNITKHSSAFDELIEDYFFDEDYPDYLDEAAIDGDEANNAASKSVEAPTQAVEQAAENAVQETQEPDEVAVVDKKEEKDKDKDNFHVIKEQDIDLLKKYILCLKANDKPQRKTSYNTKAELQDNLNKSLTAAAQVNPCTKILDKDLKFQYQNKSSVAALANTAPCPKTTTPTCPPKPECPISTTPTPVKTTTPCPVKIDPPKKTNKPDCKGKEGTAAAGLAIENTTEPITLPFDSLALVNSLNITSHLDEGNSSCPSKCSDKPETSETADPESAQYAKFLNRLKYMAHSHHPVDVIGKKPHKPLDLLKVQKMIDAAKMETMRLEGDKKPQCGCKTRDTAAVLPGSNIYNARVRRGDAFSQKLNRIITELKDSANKHKNNVADSDTSDYYDYDEIDSHYDDSTEAKKHREADSQEKDLAEKRIMRKPKKKKKKKKKKRKRKKNDSHDDDYDDGLIRLLREKKQPTNEEIADKESEHEIIDIRNHVGPNQEMALNQFLSNLEESPKQFHFDVEPFLKSRSHLYEYPASNPASRITKDVVPEKMYYDFAQNKKKRKRQLPTQIDDISLLPSYTYAQNLLNEKFNAYQFKDPENDQTAMERFYLLNDGGANIDDVYKRPKEVNDQVLKTNLNDLFMDLKLDRDFQDLEFERFKLYNLNSSNYTPTLF